MTMSQESMEYTSGVGILELMAARQVNLAFGDSLPDLLRPAGASSAASANRNGYSLRLRAAAILRWVADLLQPEPDLSPSIGRS